MGGQMRISVDKNDPGYSPFAASSVDKVKLNGEVLRYVVTADDKLGIVVYYPLDDNGRLIREDDEIFKIEASGTVEIFLKPGVDPTLLTGVQ